MEETLVHLQQVNVQLGGVPVLQNINLTIQKNEQWAIIGVSGSGKTTLAKALAGKIFFRGNIDYLPAQDPAFSPVVVLVEQQHRFKNLSHTNDFYYQQRFNSLDADNSITVSEVFQGEMRNSYWLTLLHILPLMEKPLIQLSNGENKRLQIASALLQKPTFLVLDNPFIGLDAEGRSTLHKVIQSISAAGVTVILITGPDDLPASITHVAVLENGQLVSSGTKDSFLLQQPLTTKYNENAFNRELLRSLLPTHETEFEIAVKMENVSVRYGAKMILDNINWEVRKGERWSVAGPNGAGKSTLLSLITADNPQAYANKIFLFGKKRGSGESIWDIKSKIGFLSPELHLYFEQSSSTLEVIGSGLFDTIGLFRKLSPQQEEYINGWIQLLGLVPIRHLRLQQLSTGQQRKVLLARALIKNPPLLILDEPCQGLDQTQTVYFRNLIDQICIEYNTTLIYVSHYQKDLPSCIDHFLQVEAGIVTNNI